MGYEPSQDILDKYAQVLVNFAINSGRGVQANEVVECIVPDVAKPLGLALQNTILKSGAHPMVRMLPTGFDKNFFTLADQNQLTFFPKRFLQERVKLTDHSIGVIADPDPEELKEVDPMKVITARNAKKAYQDWRIEKELKGKYTWTLGLYGVQAKADMVGLSLEEYWQQIIQACFLDQDDPVSEWKKVFALQKEILKKLNSFPVEYLTIKGSDVDLKIGLGPERQWLGGSGRNIPSFECFTSPNWRMTEGWIKFNQPLYRYGNIIDDVRLEFKDGLITKASAKRGNNFLQEMIKTPNADKLGEFSLTDRRMSRITHVMAETLFDENIGGPYGNTHVAIGMAYRDAYKGDPSKVTKRQWEKLGYNDSSEHTDIVSTTDRVVTAHLKDGSSRVIYQGGEFTV